MTGSSAPPTRTSYVLRFRPDQTIPSTNLVGGKAYHLAKLVAAGATVPPWAVVTADAFRDLAGAPEGGFDSGAAAAEWQAHVRRTVRLPEALLRDIAVAAAQPGLAGRLLAVRSSAVAEDGAQASYAGQFQTRLGVEAEELEAAILDVWASAASPHALAYGRSLSPMAVIIQRMIEPRVSGVAFGADPVTGEGDVAVVSAVFGLGEGLVSGELDADTYRIRFTDQEPRVTCTPAEKESQVALSPSGGTRTEPLPSELCGSTRTLNDERAIAIACAVRDLETDFGAPQDVEWAIGADDETLYLLQSRPITTLPPPDANGERRIWDNSNIVESYAGVTSPLTFSFARSVYEDVYRQFCAVVGVPDTLIEEHGHVFANMLGQIRGRVYYDLLNWYRTLALLPGYAVNREFMERMMGVSEKLEDPPALETTSGRGRDALRLARMVGRLIAWNRRLDRAVPQFHERVDRALAPLATEDLTRWSSDRLVELYRELEERLLRHWQPPLVNDFFAMIWFGVLGRLVERWLPTAPATLVNDLLSQQGGIISTEPATRVLELAARARTTPRVLEHFAATADPGDIAHRIASDPTCAGFHAEVLSYLATFGDRCMGELKLETVTLTEDPSFLFQTIASHLDAEASGSQPRAAGAFLAEAEALVTTELSGWRLRLFRTVLRQARTRVRDRENLRFERTRVFGVVRRIFLGIGTQLTRAGRLESPRDIFFLRVDELFGVVDGTGGATDPRALVAARKAEWEGYASQPPPPDRFESVGPVEEERWIVPGGGDGVARDSGAGLRGIGCCPGVVRAPVRLVRDPQDAGDLSGHILVAERTDPGWTLIFPAARGLLVERGSLLSHSAIVAREMGLPCIVSVRGVMAELHDGELVEMDGASGIVRRVDD